MIRTKFYNRNDFDAFVVKYESRDEFNVVGELFNRILHYCYIIPDEEGNEYSPIYGIFIFRDEIIYQKALVDESYLNEYLTENNLVVYEIVFEVSNLDELESSLKRVKTGFINPVSLYAPKTIIID